jgi:hypothetical protein
MGRTVCFVVVAIALVVIDFMRQIQPFSCWRPTALQRKGMQRQDQEQKNVNESAHNWVW